MYMAQNAVIVDDTIYRRGELSNFSHIGYRYNINHPVINQLWEQYKAFRGLPQNMAPPDKERWSFEKNVDKMIDEGRIIVK